jgi:hypothetical protein
MYLLILRNITYYTFDSSFTTKYRRKLKQWLTATIVKLKSFEMERRQVKIRKVYRKEINTNHITRRAIKMSPNGRANKVKDK